MVSHIDTAIGTVIDKLKDKGMFDNMVIVMSSDNGGPVYAGGAAGASNYPLRGGKASNWEGGIRVNGFVSGGLVPPKMRGKKLAGLTTVWDWYATLAEVAGIESVQDKKAEASSLPSVDSISQWKYWSGVSTVPPRNNITLGSKDGDVQGIILDKGPSGMWKLLTGKLNNDAWQGPSFPNASTTNFPTSDCKEVGCLFRIDADPTEHYDLAEKEKAVLAELHSMRAEEQKHVFKPNRGPQDPQSCVAAINVYGGFWGPWVFPEADLTRSAIV